LSELLQNTHLLSQPAFAKWLFKNLPIAFLCCKE
jgi:hypothetical protein